MFVWFFLVIKCAKKAKVFFFAIEMYDVCRCTDNVFLLLFSERFVRGEVDQCEAEI